MASQLLIIDVQNGFINEWTAHVPLRVAALQESFDSVLITRLYNPQKSFYRKLRGWNGFSLGSVDTQLGFTPSPDAVIVDKSTYSCINDSLLERLRRGNIGRGAAARDLQPAAVVSISTEMRSKSTLSPRLS